MNQCNRRLASSAIVVWFLTWLVGCAGSNPARSVNPKAPEGSGFIRHQLIDASGKRYGYSVFVPFDYQAGHKRPAIVFLHGQFEGGNDGVKCTTVGLGPAIARQASSFDFVAIFPQSPDGTWDDAREQSRAVAALDDAMARYSIDPRRIILTGLSTGGEGTWLMAARHPDRFAAFVPMCSADIPEALPEVARRPVWVFHNRGDPFRAHDDSKKMVALIQKAGGDARLTSYNALGHNCWDRAYRDPELFDWMRRASR